MSERRTSRLAVVGLAARLACAWIGIVGVCAVFAPLIANGHPIMLRRADGSVSSPLVAHLTPVDWLLLAWGVGTVVWLFLPWGGRRRRRLAWSCAAGGLALVVLLGALGVAGWRAPLESYPYRQMEAAGAEAAYTLVPWSPTQRVDEAGASYREPGGAHVLGTDELGQDVASQLVHACRVALGVGIVATLVATVIGVLLGALMGYAGRWVDALLMRVVEVFVAVPLLFVLVAAAFAFPRSLGALMVVIGCFTWTGAARYTRAEFMRLRETGLVESARAAGISRWSILFRHMLPNGAAPVIVETSFYMASVILLEASLSFLGLGPAERASWGRLLADAVRETGRVEWWLAMPSGLAIFLTVLSLVVLGEHLRDRLDPRLTVGRAGAEALGKSA